MPKGSGQGKRDDRLTTRQKKQLFLEMLEESHGIIKRAAALTGVVRDAYYKWCAADPKFKAKAKVIIDNAPEFVESKLFDLIEAGNSQGIIFYLKTKGKALGYDELNTFKLDGNITIEIVDPED